MHFNKILPLVITYGDNLGIRLDISVILNIYATEYVFTREIIQKEVEIMISLLQYNEIKICF